MAESTSVVIWVVDSVCEESYLLESMRPLALPVVRAGWVGWVGCRAHGCWATAVNLRREG